MTTHDLLDHLSTGVRHFLDAISYTVALGVLVHILPVTAAAMSILWQTNLRRSKHDRQIYTS